MPLVRSSDKKGLWQESGSGVRLNQTGGTAAALGTKRWQTFAGSLALNTEGGTTAYSDGDVLVELGALDVSVPTGLVAATKIVIEKVIVNVTTAADATLAATLQLSATSGTAKNAAISSGTEVVGAGAAYWDTTIDAAYSVSETDLALQTVAVEIHSPNIAVAIASKNLYCCATTTLAATVAAGRFTVQVEYTVI